MKKIGKSSYKYVTQVRQRMGADKWRAKIDQKSWGQLYDTEREAAMAVDKELIRLGEDPVNILKRKEKNVG